MTAHHRRPRLRAGPSRLPGPRPVPIEPQLGTTSPMDQIAPHDAAAVPVTADRKGSGVGRRFLATIVDALVFTAVLVPLFAAFGEDGGCDAGTSISLSFTWESEPVSLCGGIAGLWYLGVFAYYVVFEKLFGATIGKLVLGMRVTRLDGGQISWGQSLARTALRIVDGFFFYLVAAIAVWASDRNQRVGDLAAKTLVAPRG